MKYATIDIGSNTVLLLMGSFDARGKVLPLLEKAEITRLGEGLGHSSTLQKTSVERTLKVLRQFTDLCHRNQIEQIACIGTEALRRAHNSNEFVHQVEKLCGFRVEIISGKKEAELAYLSAWLDFKDLYPNLMVIDIGGGSTEVVWKLNVFENGSVKLNGTNTSKLQRVSLKLGSVRLTEKFIKEDPITPEEYDIVLQTIDKKLDHDLMRLPFPALPFTLIGLAGTLTTLCSIDQKLEIYDSLRVQGAVLELKALSLIIERLKKTTLDERKKIIGIEPKRADVLLAGALILERVMKKLKIDRVIVSDHGIRYGLFYQRFMK